VDERQAFNQIEFYFWIARQPTDSERGGWLIVDHLDA
jgi:hypothetical protein